MCELRSSCRVLCLDCIIIVYFLDFLALSIVERLELRRAFDAAHSISPVLDSAGVLGEVSSCPSKSGVTPLVGDEAVVEAEFVAPLAVGLSAGDAPVSTVVAAGSDVMSSNPVSGAEVVDLWSDTASVATAPNKVMLNVLCLNGVLRK